MPAQKLNLPYKNLILTGGSSGIGKAFIITFSIHSDKADIFNLSRSKPEISGLEEGQLRHFPSDLQDAVGLETSASELLESVEKETSGTILLINNAGFGSYGAFQDLQPGNELSMLDLNVRAVVDLTARALPLLRKRGGAVINVASTAAFQPTPYMATYGASKAFLLHWSLALHEDLRPLGIPVQALCPGPTETRFFERAGFDDAPLSGLGQTAEEVVQASLKGLERGRPLVVSGWKNKLLAGAGSKLPKAWQAPIARCVLKRMRLDRMK